MLPLLLGAGLAGFLLGKVRKTEVGRAQQPTRSALRERERRVVAMAAFHQGKRQGLKDDMAVATAKAVYQAKGGHDVAFIARLTSLDREFLGIGSAGTKNRKKLLHRKKKHQQPPPRPQGRVIRAQPRFEEQPEEEPEEQQTPEGAPPAPSAAAPQTPPAPEEPEEEPEADFPSEETSAAMAFARATDEGDAPEKAREKAKAVYQAMGGKDAAFLTMISGWSES